MKYRHKGQEAITEKIGRLNLHSIRKKTQRVNQRFSQVTGIATQVSQLFNSVNLKTGIRVPTP